MRILEAQDLHSVAEFLIAQAFALGERTTSCSLAM